MRPARPRGTAGLSRSTCTRSSASRCCAARSTPTTTCTAHLQARTCGMSTCSAGTTPVLRDAVAMHGYRHPLRTRRRHLRRTTHARKPCTCCTQQLAPPATVCITYRRTVRAGFKCVEALDGIIIRGPYSPYNLPAVVVCLKQGADNSMIYI